MIDVLNDMRKGIAKKKKLKSVRMYPDESKMAIHPPLASVSSVKKPVDTKPNNPVKSIIVNIDGKDILIPTVTENGIILSDKEAIQEYKRTGKHLEVTSKDDDDSEKPSAEKKSASSEREGFIADIVSMFKKMSEE